MDIIIQLVAAFVGSLGFSMIFNSDKKALVPATMGGMLGWGVYLLAEEAGLGLFLSTIAAAAFSAAKSQYASLLRSPPTIGAV